MTPFVAAYIPRDICITRSTIKYGMAHARAVTALPQFAPSSVMPGISAPCAMAQR